MKIRFLLSALEDMKEIKTFISQDNPKAAIKLLKKIKESTNRLGKYPYSGRMIPESQEPNLREIIIGNCLLRTRSSLLWKISSWPYK